MEGNLIVAAAAALSDSRRNGSMGAQVEKCGKVILSNTDLVYVSPRVGEAAARGAGGGRNHWESPLDWVVVAPTMGCAIGSVNL